MGGEHICVSSEHLCLVSILTVLVVEFKLRCMNPCFKIYYARKVFIIVEMFNVK